MEVEPGILALLKSGQKLNKKNEFFQLKVRSNIKASNKQKLLI